jgi:hypothetical protein
LQFFSALHEFGWRVFQLHNHIAEHSSYTSLSVMNTMQPAESLWLFAATLVTVTHISFQFAMQDTLCGTPRQKSTFDVIIQARNNVTIGEYDGMLCSRQYGTDSIYTTDCKKCEKLGKFY